MKTGVAYVGPGDIVSGAKFFWGLRAYTSASIGSDCVRIVRASDSAEQNFATVAGGGVDLAGIASFLAATSGKIVTFFNQANPGTYDCTQGTDASRPAYTTSVVGSFSGATFAGSQRLDTGTSIEGGGGLAQPITISAVAKRTGSFTSYSDIFGASNSGFQALFYNSADSVGLYAGSLITPVSCADDTFHALQFVFNGASSVMVVNGSATSSLNPGTQGWTGSEALTMGNNNNALTGVVLEVGAWASAFDSTQYADMNSNQQAYYGV